ncbi:MAG: zinc ribbon domain-containing protein [Anaerolineales bacterium]|nr:zinc ribbon domain-containing protein [Anaerolineales bacterium]
MRTCPDCHAAIDDHAKFCDNCGLQITSQQDEAISAPEENGASSQPERMGISALPRSPLNVSPGTCSACGYVNVPGEMFCQNCGVQLAPVVSAPPPPPVPISRSSVAQVEADAYQQAPLAAGVCRHCGTQNDPRERFCQNCGLQLPDTDQVDGYSPPGYADEPDSSAQAQSAAAGPTAPSSKEAAIARGRSGFVGRLVFKGAQKTIELPVDKDELLIGRSDPVRDVYPDIDLTTHGGDVRGVSRMHVRLVARDAKIYIEDLNSTNFTFLNLQRLQPGQRYELKHGDEIRLGLLAMNYMAD